MLIEGEKIGFYPHRRELKIGLSHPHGGNIFGNIKEDGDMVLKSPEPRNNNIEKSPSIHRTPLLKHPGGILTPFIKSGKKSNLAMFCTTSLSDYPAGA